jgi:hypothetical protein
MSLGPALLRMWLDADDDEVWHLVGSMLDEMTPREAKQTARDSTFFVARLIRRLKNDFPDIIDAEALVQEWGIKLAAGEMP